MHSNCDSNGSKSLPVFQHRIQEIYVIWLITCQLWAFDCVACLFPRCLTFHFTNNDWLFKQFLYLLIALTFCHILHFYFMSNIIKLNAISSQSVSRVMQEVNASNLELVPFRSFTSSASTQIYWLSSTFPISVEPQSQTRTEQMRNWSISSCRQIDQLTSSRFDFVAPLELSLRSQMRLFISLRSTGAQSAFMFIGKFVMFTCFNLCAYNIFIIHSLGLRFI